jgi:hypothetical protein
MRERVIASLLQGCVPFVRFIQPRRLGQSQHQIEVLHRSSRGVFPEIVEDGHEPRLSELVRSEHANR